TSAPTHISTLSLHDALPIYDSRCGHLERIAEPFCDASTLAGCPPTAIKIGRDLFGIPFLTSSLPAGACGILNGMDADDRGIAERSEEHTSELQSRENLVCRL